MRTLGPLERAIDIRNYANASRAARLRPIEGSYDKETKREIREHARKNLQCAVTSLRLMKPEAIGTMGYVRFRGLGGDRGAGVSPQEEFDLPWNWFSSIRDRYVLNRSDLPRFCKLYNMLSRSEFETWDRLALLLRQFNRSCQRERDEDRILDYAICLESALLSDVNTELSYRLALRAAKLLRDQRNPEHTFKHIRCLYNLRSRIVHSNESFTNAMVDRYARRVGLRPREFMRSTNALMRDLLSTVIEHVSQGKVLASLCEDLDDRIVKSL